MAGLLGGLLGLELFAATAKTGKARAPAGQLGGQLVAARLAQALVVCRVGAGGLIEDGLDLLGDRPIAARLSGRGVARDRAAVERHQPDRRQPGLRAQRQHLGEGGRQGTLVAHAKARDRGVIGGAVGADHPKRDVLGAAALDGARGALADRVGVHQQRQHHGRLMGRAAPAVLAVVGVEGAELQRLDRVDYEPGQVILGQPLAQARRQQQFLLAIAREEVLGHRAPRLDRGLLR